MWDLLTRFADCGDLIFLGNGLFWSFLFGASLPGFCLIFGGLMDDMGEMGKDVLTEAEWLASD